MPYTQIIGVVFVGVHSFRCVNVNHDQIRIRHWRLTGTAIRYSLLKHIGIDLKMKPVVLQVVLVIARYVTQGVAPIKLHI